MLSAGAKEKHPPTPTPPPKRKELGQDFACYVVVGPLHGLLESTDLDFSTPENRTTEQDEHKKEK